MVGTVSPKGRFTFGSGSHSAKSSVSGNKLELSESREEKLKRQVKTKADPTIAMYESTPTAVAFEKSNMASLRDVQHRDQFGNVITDPDRSNPTRPRFERPLDTIRSFEAAIRGTYTVEPSPPSRRPSYIRDDASQIFDYRGHKDSYYGGYASPTNGYARGHGDGGYYGGRGYQSRPDGYMTDDSWYNYSRGSRQYPRLSTDQSYANGNDHRNPYYSPHHNNNTQQDFYESSATASGTNSESWGHVSTDPSSVDSGIHQQPQPPQPITEDYGIDFAPGSSLEGESLEPQGTFYDNHNNNNDTANKPGVIKLSSPNDTINSDGHGESNGGAPAEPEQTTTKKRGIFHRATKDTGASQGKEKTKGWLKKKFNKD